MTEQDRERAIENSIDEFNEIINRRREEKGEGERDSAYIGTYRIEGEKWQTELFGTREEAERTLSIHSEGRESIIAEVTMRRILFYQCDYCGGIITLTNGFCSDMILKGVYCSISCIIKTLQESINLIQEEDIKRELLGILRGVR